MISFVMVDIHEIINLNLPIVEIHVSFFLVINQNIPITTVRFCERNELDRELMVSAHEIRTKS